MPTILCIDDNGSSLAMRQAFLEKQGYSVLTAEDGNTGLSLLRSHEINAIVLDSRMRGIDGEAVAGIIRKERPHMPIVVLTGFPEVPPGLAALADAVITKGEPSRVLLATLERLTGTKPEKPPAKISTAVEKARKLREQANAIRSDVRSFLLERQKRQAG